MARFLPCTKRLTKASGCGPGAFAFGAITKQSTRSCTAIIGIATTRQCSLELEAEAWIELDSDLKMAPPAGRSGLMGVPLASLEVVAVGISLQQDTDAVAVLERELREHLEEHALPDSALLQPGVGLQTSANGF